ASAKDNAGSGNTGYSLPVKVTVDRKKPVYDSSQTSIGGKSHAAMTGATIPWFTTSTLSIRGKYTDTSGSGVDKIYVQRDTEAAVEVSTTDGSFTTNISGFTKNSTLKIKAVDKVGNISDEQSYTIKADTSAPSLTASHYKIGEGSVSATGETVFVSTNTQITLYGNYSDSESGIKELKLQKNNSEIGSGVTFTYSETEITGTAAVPVIPQDSSYGDYNSDNAKTYKSWKAVFAVSSTISENLSVKGINNAELSASISAINITIDDANPELENIKLKETTGSGESAVTKEAYLKNEDSKYYINNTSASGKSFKLTGVVSDNYGVKKLDFSVTNTGTNNTLSIPDIQNPSGAWEVNLTGMETWSTGADVTITATDKAGRTNTESLTIVFDSLAPKAMHWADSKYKDVYFRIGRADNEKTDDNAKWETGDLVDSGTNDALNTAVGGKYAFGSYGNESTIEVRGTFEESGSGLKAVRYKIFATAPTSEQITSLVSNNGPFDGTIPVIEPETKHVAYNDGNTKKKIEVTSNFRGQISGFNTDNNYLVLVAEDYVGNIAVDTLAVYGGPEATPVTGDSKWNSADYNTVTAYYSINKDTVVPAITSTSTSQFTNGEQNITVSGSVSDSGAGVRSVVVSIDETIGSHAITYSAPASKTNGSDWTGGWTATIPAATFNVNGVDTGSVTVYATATDNAGVGNNKTISAANVIIDKVSPSISVNALTDADSTVDGTQINGKISLSGTASDANGLATTSQMKLYYTTMDSPSVESFTSGDNASTAWKEIATTAHGNSWSFTNIDTSKLDGTNAVADQTTVHFTVAATDKAGNTGYSSPVTAIVDQDSDRPVIKFTNLTLGDMTSASPLLLESTTLYGSVTDDDGIATDESGTYISYKTSASDSWHDISVTNGSFTITLVDGARDLYFKVKDTGTTAISNNGTEFISYEADTYNSSSPKLTDSASTPNKFGYRGGASGRLKTVTYLKVETTDPFKGDLKFATDYVAAVGETPASATWQEMSALTSTIFGGTSKNKVRIKIPVWDANGISSVSITVPGLQSSVAFTPTTESP
nr:hypothetical protein [Treponema sp.]